MGKKLLVADDSVTIQKVIKLALSSEGYDILAVSEGKEAIRAIQEERPDVVIIDVSLPGADAYAVKRAINADPKAAGAGFILMTSAFERVDEKAIEELKFHGRLVKPFDPSHLRKAVAELIASPQKAEPAASTAMAAPPPPAGAVAGSGEDLPPMRDTLPTITEEQIKPLVSEEDFSELESKAVPTVAPPPPPEEDRTDPQFMAPPAGGEETHEQAAAQTLENDIKNLTESTIKMSGLDDYQWSLEDSKKMKPGAAAVAPPPPPPPAPTDPEQTRELPRPFTTDKKVSPLKSLMAPPSKPIDDGGSNFPLKTAGTEIKAPGPALTAPRLTVPQAVPPPGSDLISGRDYVAPPPPMIDIKPAAPPAAAAYGPAMTRAEIEELVRKDLEAVLEKFARETVPQIAEAIIRKEIEKILAEP